MNYVKNFGVQWNRHAKTQLDSYTGIPLSERRFFSQTQWKKNLPGEKVLEVGCGAGRFTEIISKTRAFVVSIDYSEAAFANEITTFLEKYGLFAFTNTLNLSGGIKVSRAVLLAFSSILFSGSPAISLSR